MTGRLQADESFGWERPGLFRLFPALFLGLALAAGSAPAETRDCLLDNCADAPAPQSGQGAADGFSRRGPRRSGVGAPGEFDFYVLALSWSAAFCKTASAVKAPAQCARGANLGFVVHGLWPQYERGYPSDCGPAARSPSRIAIESATGLFPDEGLARYEWRRHGTCSGKSPTDYFADVRRARAAVAIPPPFQAPKEQQTWTPVDIERAFIAANRRLRPGMIGVACAGGVLQEVRICFSKDLRDFRACPEVSRQGCRAREVAAPAPL